MQLSHLSGTVKDSCPYIVREGIYGETVMHQHESIYFRMELLTKDNESSWTKFSK